MMAEEAAREANMKLEYDAAERWIRENPDYRGWIIVQHEKVMGKGATRELAYVDARKTLHYERGRDCYCAVIQF